MYIFLRGLVKGPFSNEKCYDIMQNSQNFHSYTLILIPNLSNLECKRLISMPSKAIFYFHFDIFIFENKVARDKMQLKGQFVLCPAAMECPGSYGYKRSIFLFKLYLCTCFETQI